MTPVKAMTLTYVGNDSCGRPVYRNRNSLFVDVEPLSDCEPKICTKLYNHFDGEPDVSVRSMAKYKDTKITFSPQRIVWR